MAYVLGQLQDKASTDALVSILKNVHEHPMVRHEAAEALGAIAGTISCAILDDGQTKIWSLGLQMMQISFIQFILWCLCLGDYRVSPQVFAINMIEIAGWKCLKSKCVQKWR